MERYRKFVQHQKKNHKHNEWMNNRKMSAFTDHEMENIYFNNRDIKLLLDLLATCSGIEQSLRILVLFDSNLKSYFRPGNLEFVNEMFHAYVPINEVNISTISGVQEEVYQKKIVYDISIEFSESIIMANLLNNVDDLVGIYTVEIYPRTSRSTIHTAIKVTPEKATVDTNKQNALHIFSARLYDMEPEQRY